MGDAVGREIGDVEGICRELLAQLQGDGANAREEECCQSKRKHIACRDLYVVMSKGLVLVSCAALGFPLPGQSSLDTAGARSGFIHQLLSPTRFCPHFMPFSEYRTSNILIDSMV